MNPSQTNIFNSTRARLGLLAGLVLLLSVAGPNEPAGFSEFERREYYYQPPNKEYLKILAEREVLITEIMRQRALTIWGDSGIGYLNHFGETPYEGYYQQDSVFAQRRTSWRSSLYASDLDFIEVSLSTIDGKFSLHETYGISRADDRWVVVDSAGFPLFERINQLTADSVSTARDLGNFLLTLLSYAGYGSYDILGSLDTIYHGIDLQERLAKEFYPFRAIEVADTTEVEFTACLRGGVEVSNWRILYFDDGIIIDENEQLLTYLDLPTPELDSLETDLDTGALAGLLTDLPGDTTGATSNLSSIDRIDGDVRLADLLRAKRPKAPTGGRVSYEIIGYKLAELVKDTVIEIGPEFVIFSEPLYPPLALAEKKSGVLDMMVKVDTLGHVRQPMVIKKSGTPYGFEVNAKKAASLCTLRPGRAGGRPVEIWLTYRLRFGFGITDNKTSTTPPLPSARGQARLEAEGSSPAAVDSLSVDSSGVDTLGVDTLGADSLLDSLTDSLADSLIDSLPDPLADTLLDTLPDTLPDTLLDTLADSVLSDTSSAPDSVMPDTTADTTSETDSDTTETSDTTESD